MTTTNATTTTTNNELLQQRTTNVTTTTTNATTTTTNNERTKRQHQSHLCYFGSGPVSVQDKSLHRPSNALYSSSSTILSTATTTNDERRTTNDDGGNKVTAKRTNERKGTNERTNERMMNVVLIDVGLECRCSAVGRKLFCEQTKMRGRRGRDGRLCVKRMGEINRIHIANMSSSQCFGLIRCDDACVKPWGRVWSIHERCTTTCQCPHTRGSVFGGMEHTSRRAVALLRKLWMVREIAQSRHFCFNLCAKTSTALRIICETTFRAQVVFQPGGVVLVAQKLFPR